MDKKELKIVITTKEKIISTNSLYNAGLKYIGGRPRPYIYKSPKVSKFTQEVIEQLRAVDFSDYIEWLKTTKQFDITISFILKSNVTRRDVQNLDKLLIDIVTKYIKEELKISKFDDSLFNSVHFYKSIIPNSNHEFICISMSESKVDLRFDKVEKPDKFFLESDINDKFKKEIKKELKDKKLKFYSKIEEKDKSNTKLFIVCPESKSILLEVNNIINSIWECVTSGIGFIFIGIKNSDEWPKELKSQLDEIINTIKINFSESTRVKIRYFDDINNLFINL